MPLEQKYKYYQEAFAESATLVPELSKALLNLEPLIFCPEYCTEGGLSYDDIDLWARLRSMTVIKGIEYPPKVRARAKARGEGGVPRLSLVLRGARPH
jgi:glutaredoxin 2